MTGVALSTVTGVALSTVTGVALSTLVSPFNIILPLLHTNLLNYNWRYKILVINSVVKQTNKQTTRTLYPVTLFYPKFASLLTQNVSPDGNQRSADRQSDLPSLVTSVQQSVLFWQTVFKEGAGNASRRPARNEHVVQSTLKLRKSSEPTGSGERQMSGKTTHLWVSKCMYLRFIWWHAYRTHMRTATHTHVRAYNCGINNEEWTGVDVEGTVAACSELSQQMADGK